MKKINADLAILKSSNNILVGMQRIANSEDKVLLWMKGVVKPPLNKSYSNREVIISQRVGRGKYIKNIVNNIFVFQHLHRKLRELGITAEDEKHLFKSKHLAKWITRDNEERDFIPLLIKDPVSEIENKPFNIEIIQSLKPPLEAAQRAMLEANGDIALFKSLKEKYEKRSIVKKYASTDIIKNGHIYKARTLSDVYILKGDKYRHIYEYGKIIIGEPKHTIIYDRYGISKSKNLNKGLFFNRDI